MFESKRWWTVLFVAGLAVAGCGESEPGESPPDDSGVLFETAEASSDDCPGGGTVITVGTDADDDGELADGEIDETITVCNGDGGDDNGGEDGCSDRDPLSPELTLEAADNYRTDQTYTLEIATAAGADTLQLSALQGAGVGELRDGDDGLEADLQFETTGQTELTLVASDGCSVDVSRLELESPVYPPSYDQLEAGWMHTCGLRTDGSVSCWGEDPATLLEFSLAGHTDAPEKSDFTAISAALFSTCGLHEDDTVSCWGTSVGGTNETTTIRTPQVELQQLSTASQYICGVTPDGLAHCVDQENTANFEFGVADVLDAPSDETILEVHPLEEPSSMIVVRLDNEKLYGVTVAQDTDGDGNTTYNFDAQQLLDEEDAVYQQLDAGAGTICGIDGLDRGVCHVFIDDETFYTSENGVVDVSAGGYHGCVRFDDGQIECLGSGAEGQLDNLNRNETELDVPADITFTRDLTAGVLHTCGLTDDGLVSCWGDVVDPFGEEYAASYPSVTDPIQ